MEWIVSLITILLVLLVIAAVIVGGFLLLYYGFFGFFDLWTKPANIRKMRELPEGTIFTAHGKGAGETFRKIAPIFEFWEDPDAEGNCTYCGSFLFIDNVKWRKVNSTET